MDFSSTHWDLIRAGAYEDNEEPATDIISPNLEETCKMIDSVAEDLKRRLRKHPLDEQLFSGTNKFIDRYNCYSSRKSNAMLTSALHKFGWVFGGSICYVTKVWKTASWKTNYDSSHSCWQT